MVYRAFRFSLVKSTFRALRAFLFLTLGITSAADLTFPPGAILNVRDHGLPGDGTDQTDSLEALLIRTVGSYRHLYFPAGTYVISRTLEWRDADKVPQSGLTWVGESRERTVIRLADRAPGFDALAGKPMLRMFSQKGSGNGNGEENSAFRNSLRNLTFDVGKGNPGAVAVDYMCNNIGSIQDVSFRASDTASGKIAIKANRGSPGPALLRNISIAGFRYGLTTDCRIGGLVLEHVSLSGQKAAGIRNCQNTLSIRDLRSVNSVPAIQNVLCPESPFDVKLTGMVVLIDGRLEGGGKGAIAIENEGSLLLRNVSTKDYKSVLINKGVMHPKTSIAEYTTSWNLARGRKSRFALYNGASATLGLPVKEAAPYFDADFRNWAIVTDSAYGAIPDDDQDDGPALRKALASGKSTIFLKRGYYIVEDPLPVGGKVRHILGDNAWIAARGFESRRASLLHIDSTARFDIRIENLDLRDKPGTRNDSLTLVRHDSRHALVLSGVYMMCMSNAIRAYEPGPKAGDLHIEDVANTGASRWRFGPGQKVWARQFNPEGLGPKIISDGAVFWVLGLKTENPGTVLQAGRGALTEVLGGMIVPADEVAEDTPAFVLEDCRASLSYAYNNALSRNGAWYSIQVADRKGKARRAMRWDSVAVSDGNPVRNLHVPLYSSPLEGAGP